eukprot:439910-Prymnesium_polylepis.1
MIAAAAATTSAACPHHTHAMCAPHQQASNGSHPAVHLSDAAARALALSSRVNVPSAVRDSCTSTAFEAQHDVLRRTNACMSEFRSNMRVLRVMSATLYSPCSGRCNTKREPSRRRSHSRGMRAAARSPSPCSGCT